MMVSHELMSRMLEQGSAYHLSYDDAYCEIFQVHFAAILEEPVRSAQTVLQYAERISLPRCQAIG